MQVFFILTLILIYLEVRGNFKVDIASLLPEFTYTGTYELINDGKNGTVQNWRIKFLTSGTLKFTKVVDTINVFLVGGGGGSQYMSGGGGGYTNTSTVHVSANTNYNITVGAGGAGYGWPNTPSDGGSTTAFGYTAAGGKVANYAGSGGNGGSGGSAGVNSSNETYQCAGGSDGSDGSGNRPGRGQGTTTREFGESSGTLYATGGGMAGHWGAGWDAAANTGNGGTGSGSVNSGPAKYCGKGGSGIVVIRNAR